MIFFGGWTPGHDFFWGVAPGSEFFVIFYAPKNIPSHEIRPPPTKKLPPTLTPPPPSWPLPPRCNRAFKATAVPFVSIVIVVAVIIVRAFS